MTARKYALALLVLCTALRVISLVRPCLSDDEATYCVVGREMASGHALYRDVVDHKPPAIYIINEVCQQLGGPVGGMVLLHLLLILVVWGTAMLIGRIAARIDARSAPIAALLYIVFTTTLIDTDSLAANCELFMMLPLVASVEAFLAGQWITTGMMVGAAILCKYQAGIQLPLYGLAIIVADRRQPLRILLRGAAIAF
ncbi:MAG TPA: glycosyltransferase family 39 protein, partial [Kofleriaceae bacterium]